MHPRPVPAVVDRPRSHDDEQVHVAKRAQAAQGEGGLRKRTPQRPHAIDPPPPGAEDTSADRTQRRAPPQGARDGAASDRLRDASLGAPADAHGLGVTDQRIRLDAVTLARIGRVQAEAHDLDIALPRAQLRDDRRDDDVVSEVATVEVAPQTDPPIAARLRYTHTLSSCPLDRDG